MKNLIFVFFISTLLFVCSCGEENLAPVFDAVEQRKIETELIDKYLEDNGYSNVDTTTSGVRYVIIDEGTGDNIEESDIVTFDYTGRLLNDTIFDSSIKTVTDSIRTVVAADSVGLEDKLLHSLILVQFPEVEENSPLRVTYSASGWPFDSQLIRGFTDGIIATFDNRTSQGVKIGGKVLIVIPSDLAYSSTGITYPDGATYLIDPDVPILFEIYPIKLQKQ